LSRGSKRKKLKVRSLSKGEEKRGQKIASTTKKRKKKGLIKEKKRKNEERKGRRDVKCQKLLGGGTLKGLRRQMTWGIGKRHKHPLKSQRGAALFLKKGRKS